MILKRIKHEFIELLPPTIFFFISFTLIAATARLTLLQYGITLEGFGVSIVGALFAGKIILLSDKLPFVNKFPGKPLIYNTLWKSSIYFIVSLIIHYYETFRHPVDKILWHRFWLIQMWLAVLFLIYCGMRELFHEIGREKVLQMFFGRSQN